MIESNAVELQDSFNDETTRANKAEDVLFSIMTAIADASDEPDFLSQVHKMILGIREAAESNSDYLEKLELRVIARSSIP